MPYTMRNIYLLLYQSRIQGNQKSHNIIQRAKIDFLQSLRTYSLSGSKADAHFAKALISVYGTWSNRTESNFVDATFILRLDSSIVVFCKNEISPMAICAIWRMPDSWKSSLRDFELGILVELESSLILMVL